MVKSISTCSCPAGKPGLVTTICDNDGDVLTKGKIEYICSQRVDNTTDVPNGYNLEPCNVNLGGYCKIEKQSN